MTTEDPYMSVQVMGGSMMPAILPGTRLLATKSDIVRDGDVVVIQIDQVKQGQAQESSWLVHRVAGTIRIGHREWIVHIGDASSVFGFAAKEDVWGIISSVSNHRNWPWRVSCYVLVLKMFAVVIGDMIQFKRW